MNLAQESTHRYARGSARHGGGFGGILYKIWRHYENSSIPLSFKWSVSIAALIVLAMGVLGSYLIQQQDASYRSQVDRFSQVIVEQLARIIGEPLMAADTLALQILLQRHSQSELILGTVLHDANLEQVMASGVNPPEDPLPRLRDQGFQSWDWENGGYQAVSYLSPVEYQDVVAGYLTVSIDRSPLEADLQQTLHFLMISTSLLILVGVVLASILAYRLTRPIERLARAGEALEGHMLDVVVERRDEIGQVLETFKTLARGAQQKHVVEAAFSRYVSPQVARTVLESDTSSALGGSCVTGSVLFCDIVGFTEMSETRKPDEVAALLNDYFGHFALAAESCGGTVDKFIGDAIMIVFGAPHPDAHHDLHALTCGMLIQQLTNRINRIREPLGQATVKLRVGVSSGSMSAGNVGNAERMQYTVVGDTVNVAARLCALAEPGGVLLTGSMLAGGQPGSLEHYADLGPALLKGRKTVVEVCSMDVEAVAHEVNADQLIERILSSAGH